MRKFVFRFIIGFFLLIFGLVAWWLITGLPVASGYAAKNICSCLFVAERAEAPILQDDVDKIVVRNAVNRIDYEKKQVTSTVWGLAQQTAVYRGDEGCVLRDRTESLSPTFSGFEIPTTPNPDTLPWPTGNVLTDTLFPEIDYEHLDQVIQRTFHPAEGERDTRTRAWVIVYKGRIVREYYAEGFDLHTRINGWSMMKSVTNALIGIRVRQGKLQLDQPTGLSEWQGDERQSITLNHLLQMTSGLKWLEGYYVASDVTKMLYVSPDVSQFAKALQAKDTPGETWNYSSGSTNIASEILQQSFPNQTAYLRFPYEELFHKIGMYSMLVETDTDGTFIGSSYGWATPRDWARFGLLYLNEGVWEGERILPEGWVDYSKTSSAAANGVYGSSFWLNESGFFGEDLPRDMYACTGHDGQRVHIFPSQDLVIVRMGLSYPSNEQLLGEVLKAFE